MSELLKDTLCFTTTALCRPDILSRTFKSFSSNIKEDLKQFKLYINVDPIPNSNISEILEISNNYFGEVIYRSPEIPNFATAIKWCWKQASTDYVFHLEDDWILNTEISLKNIISMFNTTTFQIILPAYAYTYEKMVLSPSIIKNSVCKLFSEKMVEDVNPEVQLRNKDIIEITSGNIKVVTNKIIVSDIGRRWLKKEQLVKPKKYDFVRY